MNAHLFSAVMGVLGAAAIVGSILCFVGGGLVLARAGENPLKILIPVYGPYRLAHAGRVVMLFWAIVLCVGATLFCWSLPTGDLQQLGILPLGLLWSLAVLVAVSVAECFHGSPALILVAIVAPPLALVLAGAGTKGYDPSVLPSIPARFWKLERRLSGPLGPLPLPETSAEVALPEELAGEAQVEELEVSGEGAAQPAYAMAVGTGSVAVAHPREGARKTSRDSKRTKGTPRLR